jgi:hypothetical protein
MSENNPQYIKLRRYVDAASDLAEQVTKDVKKGSKITNDTVLKLSKFYAAAERIKKEIAILQDIPDDLN